MPRETRWGEGWACDTAPGTAGRGLARSLGVPATVPLLTETTVWGPRGGPCARRGELATGWFTSRRDGGDSATSSPCGTVCDSEPRGRLFPGFSAYSVWTTVDLR